MTKSEITAMRCRLREARKRGGYLLREAAELTGFDLQSVDRAFVSGGSS